MDSPLDVATTREIRRELAAAKAALTYLEALLAPIAPDTASDHRGSTPAPRTSDGGGRR